VPVNRGKEIKPNQIRVFGITSSTKAGTSIRPTWKGPTRVIPVTGITSNKEKLPTIKLSLG
jgi:hypothetical protein